MVLSLSPGPAPLEHAQVLKKNANMWRMTDDFWDSWDYLYPMFERCAKWAEHVSPHNWPDCDMLPLGHIGIRSVDGGGADRFTRFTKNEQMTMMTLWSIFRSPLMFGGELRDNDEWTLHLLTHSGLTEMQQSITKSRQVFCENDLVIWTADADNSCYAALFNTGSHEKSVEFEPKFWGMQAAKDITDVWKNSTAEKGRPISIGEHGVTLLKMER
jgi:hypothetical protein